jgi:hypothetical protein
MNRGSDGTTKPTLLDPSSGCARLRKATFWQWARRWPIPRCSPHRLGHTSEEASRRSPVLDEFALEWYRTRAGAEGRL